MKIKLTSCTAMSMAALVLVLVGGGGEQAPAQECGQVPVLLTSWTATTNLAKVKWEQFLPDPNNPPPQVKMYKKRTEVTTSYSTNKVGGVLCCVNSRQADVLDGNSQNVIADEAQPISPSQFWLDGCAIFDAPAYSTNWGAANGYELQTRYDGSLEYLIHCHGIKLPDGTWAATNMTIYEPPYTNWDECLGDSPCLVCWPVGIEPPDACSWTVTNSVSSNYSLVISNLACSMGPADNRTNYSFTVEVETTPTRQITRVRQTRWIDTTNTVNDEPESIYSFFGSTNQVDLADEYSTSELVGLIYTNLLTVSYGEPINGQADARFFLSEQERCGSMTAMRYQFAVPQTDAETSYRVEWEEVTRFDNADPRTLGVPVRARKLWELIRGSGLSQSGLVHTAQIPLAPGRTTVENMVVKPMPKRMNSGSGAAPGSGGPGSSCTSCGMSSPGGNDWGFFFHINMGMTGAGEEAGALLLAPPMTASAPCTNLADYAAGPRMLSYSMANGNGVNVVTDSHGGIQQVSAPQATAVVTTISATEFLVSIYPAGSSVADVVWRVKNPGGAVDKVRITKEFNGQVLCTYDYLFTGNSPVYSAGNPWEKDDKAAWTLKIQNVTYQTLSLESEQDSARVESNTIWDAGLVYTAERHFQRFDWGEALVNEIIGGKWVTQFNYATGVHSPCSFSYYTNYISPEGHQRDVLLGSPVPLLSVQWPDGSWEAYPVADALGRVTTKVQAFGNVAVPDLDNPIYYDPSTGWGAYYDLVQNLRSQCRVVDYGFYNGDPFSYTPSSVIETLLEHTVRESSTSIADLGGGAYTRTDVAYAGDGSSLTTFSTIEDGRAVSTLFPDGTLKLYNLGGLVETVSHGQPDANGAVVDGSTVRTTYNSQGQVISKLTWDIALGESTGVIGSETWSDFDLYQRPRRVDYLGGEYESRTFSCCGLATATDREGVMTSYDYDCQGRQYTSTRLGITTTLTLGPLDQVVQRTITGSNNTITAWSGSYDTAGLLTLEYNLFGGATAHQAALVNGVLVRTNLYPDNGQRIETYYPDGSLHQVTGSAAQPFHVDYGIGELDGIWYPYLKETKLDTNGAPTSEWTQTYTDWLERPIMTVASDSPANAVSRKYYNAAGQLEREVDPDGVMTLYEYNLKGELTRTALNVADSGGAGPAIDLAGTDRIIETVSAVSQRGGTTVHRTETRVWNTDNANTPVTVAIDETAADGHHVWATRLNQTTTTEIGLPSGGVRTATTYFPDNSTLARTYQWGRMASFLRKDSSNNPIKSLNLGYDDYGRMASVADGRDGTTTAALDVASRNLTVTAPIPAAGQPHPVTVHHYDTSGREDQTTLPDNSVVSRQYFPSSRLQQVAGSHTYPAGYGYDAQGRVKSLTTWQNYPGSGAATTTWSYNQRGFLQAKAYQGSVAGPGYTYTAGGRLKTLVRASGVTATYHYAFEDPNSSNLSDDLLQVSYSGGTPAVNLSFDRLGRPHTTGVQGGPGATLTYNDADELLSESFTSGPLTGLSLANGYDGLLRRSTVSVLNGATPLTSAGFGYDGASRLQSVAFGSTSATYGYVPNSLLVSNIAFKLNTTTMLTTTRKHDLLDRLASVSSVNNQQTTVSSFAYAFDLLDQRTSAVCADNAFWSYQYDALGQVISGRKQWADNSLVAGQQFQYSFDTIGNRTQTKTGGGPVGQGLHTASYTRDLLNRYQSREVPGYVPMLGTAVSNAAVSLWSSAGQYGSTSRHGEYFSGEVSVTNGVGPIWVTITNLAVLNNGTNLDKVTSNVGNVLVAPTPESFGYDPDGNLTNNGLWGISWDAENRAKSFQSRSGVPVAAKRKVDCTYDYAWRRVEKIVSTNNGSVYVAVSTNRFVYDGWNLAAVLDGGNNPVLSFAWGSDASGTMRGAGGVGGLLAMKVHNGTNAGTYFYVYDGNFNVMALVNAADGSVAAQYEYGPFAELLRATGPLAQVNPFLFSTKFYDWETGFYYYGYRYFDPGTGRWLSPDPLEETGGLNLRAFVGNDPEDDIDPFGLTNEPGAFGWGLYWTPLAPELNPWATVSTPARKEAWLECGCRQAACPKCSSRGEIGPATAYVQSTPSPVTQDFFNGMGASHIGSLRNADEWRARVAEDIALNVAGMGAFYWAGESWQVARIMATDSSMSFRQACAFRYCANLRNAPLPPTMIGTEAAEGGVSPITDPARLLPAPKAVPRDPLHHIFPQRTDLAAEFRTRSIDPHDFTMQIPKPIHQEIHCGGPRGGAWNQAWEDFFRVNPSATATDVYKEAGRLIYEFQVPGGPIVPYAR
ncbi:MAG: TIGR02269 family lipoprotein [Verrucomicrobiota bacterium]